ncbi:MAG TPA: ABC transporter permease, partial [Flavobacteriaceae bacterium]|nr:ABC transporter permease [Flavobacteriaceae bacterium]
MDKLKLIIVREFLAKVKNKSFIILTILSPVLMVGLFMLIVFLNQKNSEDIRKIAVVDETGQLASIFKSTAVTKYEDLSAIGFAEAKEQAKELYYGLVYIPKGEDLNVVAKNISFYSAESPSLNVIQSI